MTTTTILPVNIETTRLRTADTDEGTLRSVRALLFGEMVQRASAIKAYHGDLYHDALWLHENLGPEGLTFEWSTRDCGTYIGTDLAAAVRQSSPMTFYRIHVRVERHWWVAVFEEFDVNDIRSAA